MVLHLPIADPHQKSTQGGSLRWQSKSGGSLLISTAWALLPASCTCSDNGGRVAAWYHGYIDVKITI